MKLEADDPRLSAWVLGELPPHEAEEVEQALAADPALQAFAAELRGVGDLLSSSLAATALRPDQRAAVLEAGRAGKIVDFPGTGKRQRIWPALIGAAAVLAAGVFIASRLETRDSSPVAEISGPEKSGDPAPQPLRGPRILPPKEAGRAVQKGHLQPRPPEELLDSQSRELADRSLAEASGLPATTPLAPLREAAEIELPVLVGQASYERVRGWIRGKNELPPKDAVRIEELANAFPLPAAEETREFAGLRVACVSMTSLWSGPGRLVGVQIANETDAPKPVAWSFSPALESRAGGVRVLASTGPEGQATALLPPGRRTLVLIELASASGDAGDLVVSSEGRSKRFPAVESRDPALKQAALVAAFGMWLRGEGIDDSRLVAILAAAGEESDPAWADSRRLVREALGIAAAKR